MKKSSEQSKKKMSLYNIFSALVAVWFLYCGYDMVVTGEVSGRTNTYSREDSPVFYMIMLVLYFGGFIFVLLSLVWRIFKK